MCPCVHMHTHVHVCMCMCMYVWVTPSKWWQRSTWLSFKGHNYLASRGEFAHHLLPGGLPSPIELGKSVLSFFARSSTIYKDRSRSRPSCKITACLLCSRNHLSTHPQGRFGSAAFWANLYTSSHLLWT